MRYIEGRCVGPIVKAQKGFQEVWRRLCGMETLLENFPIFGACLEEVWVRAREQVLLGFGGFTTASACGCGPVVTSVHVVSDGERFCVEL